MYIKSAACSEFIPHVTSTQTKKLPLCLLSNHLFFSFFSPSFFLSSLPSLPSSLLSILPVLLHSTGSQLHVPELVGKLGR